MQSSRELSVLAVELQMLLGSVFKHRMAFAFRGFEGNNGKPASLRENSDFDCSGMRHFILHLLQVGNSFKYLFNVCEKERKGKERKRAVLWKENSL